MRSLLPVAALMAVMAAAPQAHAAGDVLVMNSAGASLSVIDMASKTELCRIPVLREPHHVMLTPDKRDLLVGDSAGNELVDLDPNSFAVRRHLPVSDPYQLGFSPNGKFLVVNGIARAQVDIYDPATYKLIKRFPLPTMPSHMDFAPDSGMVYVSLQGTGKLAAIDLRTMTVSWETAVGPAPAGVLWHNGLVLVAVMGADYVAVVDPATGKLDRRIHTGKGAHQLFLSPDGKIIYVNDRVEGTVVALNAATLIPEQTYKLPGGPDDIVFAPDGHVWFTLRFDHKVAVMDPASGTYDTIEVGRSPHGIFMNPRAVVKCPGG